MPTPLPTSPQPATRSDGSVRVIPHYDVQWRRPIFRAPTLPSPTQIYAEVPFTAVRLLRAKAIQA